MAGLNRLARLRHRVVRRAQRGASEHDTNQTGAGKGEQGRAFNFMQGMKTD